MQQEDRSTEPVNFIRFHGISVLVARNGADDYIDFKQLVDGIGLDWRTQKAAIQTDENAEVYGLKTLIPPHSAGAGGASPPQGTPVHPARSRPFLYRADQPCPATRTRQSQGSRLLGAPVRRMGQRSARI